MPYECRQCGAVSAPPVNCVHCGGRNCMAVFRPPMVGGGENLERMVRDLHIQLVNARPFVEMACPDLGENHVCGGPDSQCDCDCANAAHIGELLRDIDRVLRESEAVAEEARVLYGNPEAKRPSGVIDARAELFEEESDIERALKGL